MAVNRRHDIELNGRGLMVKHGTYKKVFEDIYVSPRDLETSAGESPLSRFWWQKRFSDFSGGGGQKYAESKNAQENRILDSQDMDFSTPGEAKLMKAMAVSLSKTGTNGYLLSAAGKLWLVNGTDIYNYNGSAWSTAVATGVTGNIVCIADDGSNLFGAGTSGGIFYGSTSAWASWATGTGSQPTAMAFINRELYGVQGGKLYKLATGASQSTEVFNAGPDWTLKWVTGHNQKIVFGGYKGSAGDERSFVWESDGTTSGTTLLVDDLPDGYKGYGGLSYLDVLYIWGGYELSAGTTAAGILYAYTNGALTIGGHFKEAADMGNPLRTAVPTIDTIPRCALADGQFVYFGMNERSGLWRYDLKEGGLHRSFSAVTTNNLVTGVAAYKGKIYTAHSGAGAFVEQTTTASSGLLKTSATTFGTSNSKVGRQVFVNRQSSTDAISFTTAADAISRVGYGSSQAINDVAMESATVGVAVGDGGAIYTTADGWSTVTSRTSGTSQNLNSVVYLGTGDYAVCGNGGVILRSLDQGATWAAATSGTTVDLTDCGFASAAVGWFVGGSWTILKTTDFNDATIGDVSFVAQTNGVTGEVRGISVIDANNVFIGRLSSGTTHLVFKTVDGGTTWTAVASNLSASYRLCMSISFVSTSVGWWSGWDNWNLYLYKTEDGGTTWTQQWTAAADGDDVLFVKMLSATVGWFAGANGVIRKTTDGTTWTAQTSGTSASLNAIAIVDASNVNIVGNSGIILDTSNGGTAWAKKTWPAKIAQSFTDTTGANFSSLKLWLAASNSAASRLKVELRNISGGLPGDTVHDTAYVNVPDAAVGTTLSNLVQVSIVFTGDYTLSIGTVYAIVLTYDGTNDYYWNVGHVAAGGHANGARFTGEGADENWISTATDCPFVITAEDADYLTVEASTDDGLSFTTLAANDQLVYDLNGTLFDAIMLRLTLANTSAKIYNVTIEAVPTLPSTKYWEMIVPLSDELAILGDNEPELINAQEVYEALATVRDNKIPVTFKEMDYDMQATQVTRKVLIETLEQLSPYYDIEENKLVNCEMKLKLREF